MADAVIQPEPVRTRAWRDGVPARAALALACRRDAPAADRCQAALALDALDLPMLITDARGVIRQCNAAAAAALRVEPPHREHRLTELVALRDRSSGVLLEDPVHRCIDLASRIELVCSVTVRHAYAVERLVELTVAPLHHGAEVAGAVVSLRDVTRIQELLRVLEHAATHDALTRLLNRREFLARLEQQAVGSGSSGDAHALLYLDLDRFKQVNERGGHGDGDSVLREVAAVLKAGVRQRDSLARLGGDEFAMLLQHCSAARAVAIAREIRGSVLRRLFGASGQVYRLGVSIGVAMSSPSTADAASWLAQADHACYEAKRGAGGGVCVARGDHG